MHLWARHHSAGPLSDVFHATDRHRRRTPLDAVAKLTRLRVAASQPVSYSSTRYVRPDAMDRPVPKGECPKRRRMRSPRIERARNARSPFSTSRMRASASTRYSTESGSAEGSIRELVTCAVNTADAALNFSAIGASLDSMPCGHSQPND